MRCPKIALIEKSEESHMISNDFEQSGAKIIEAETSSYFNLSHAFRHPLSK